MYTCVQHDISITVHSHPENHFLGIWLIPDRTPGFSETWSGYQSWKMDCFPVHLISALTEAAGVRATWD